MCVCVRLHTVSLLALIPVRHVKKIGGAGVEVGLVLAGWEHRGTAGVQGIHLKCIGSEVGGPQKCHSM